MLKKNSLFLFQRFLGRSIPIGCSSSMALNRALVSASYCGASTLSQHKDGCLISQHKDGCLIPKNLSIEKKGGVSGSSCWPNFLSWRGCLDKQNSVSSKIDDEHGKAHAGLQYCEFVQDKNVGYMGKDMVNGQKHGTPVGFPHTLLQEKLNVAVDVDEVLGSFLSALNKFISDRYHSNHSISEYYVYEFFKVWNCSKAEADIRVHEFFKTPYFQKGIHPIPGARRVLDKLSPFCNLSVVTSRQNVIKDHTLEWIENHYPGLFQEIHFGNHFALDGLSRPKSEICSSLGAKVLIDDNPRYALECAKVGIKVLLFDYDNSYPWSKSELAISHPLVTKVRNWDEVEKSLISSLVTYD